MAGTSYELGSSVPGAQKHSCASEPAVASALPPSMNISPTGARKQRSDQGCIAGQSISSLCVN